MLNSFYENPKEELLQYIRNNEDDFENKYSTICKTLNSFINDKNTIIDFKDIYYKLSLVRFGDLKKFKQKFKDILSKIDDNHYYYNFFMIFFNLINYLKAPLKGSKEKNRLELKSIGGNLKDHINIKIPQRSFLLFGKITI